MRLINFWLLKAKEKTLLKVVEWSQKYNKKVQALTHDEIKEALRSQR